MAKQKTHRKAGQGTLELRGKQWWARVNVLVDGAVIRKRYPLGTELRAVAKAKLAQLVAEVSAGTEVHNPTAVETVEQACRRVVEQQGRDGLKTGSNGCPSCGATCGPSLGTCW